MRSKANFQEYSSFSSFSPSGFLQKEGNVIDLRFERHLAQVGQQCLPRSLEPVEILLTVSGMVRIFPKTNYPKVTCDTSPLLSSRDF